MRRRIAGALKAAAGLDDVYFVPSGAVGKYGPSEASVMRDLLVSAGIDGARIILEDRSSSTVGSAVNCTRIIRHRYAGARVLVCTDLYHHARTRWLFRLAGVAVETPHMPGGFSAIYFRRWLYYIVREVFAIPVDTVWLVGHRWLGLPLKG
jgi:uncharacterized SAM-binding protein YcdF (DUF218 family)